MAGVKERAFLTRLLRESVLTLCREAMDSHRRFIVDGIVCISLEDDGDDEKNNTDNDDNGRCGDLSPIVITIHEPLSKLKSDSGSESVPAPASLRAKPIVCDSQTPSSHPNPNPNPSDSPKQEVPMGKKTIFLRRILQDHSLQPQDDVTDPAASPGPVMTSNRRCVSEDVPRKVPRLQQEGEEEVEEEGAMDGHWSDPSPVRRRSGTVGMNLTMPRHSLSQSSDGSDKAPAAAAATTTTTSTPWRASLSSPATSDVSSTAHDDAARADSASPEHGPRLVQLPSRFPPPRAARYTCKKCGEEAPDLLSLDRHHRQLHSLFTCHQCLATFTTCNNLRRHARLHSGVKPFKCTVCGMAFSRRDDLKSHRQRHLNSHFRHRSHHYNHVHHHSHHHHQRRDRADARRWLDRSCSLCPYVGGSLEDVRQHLLSHCMAGNLACLPCAISFPTPRDYSCHLRLHSRDPDFRHYACCYCSAVLSSHEQFLAHQRLHEGPRHTNAECGNSFRSDAHVSNHLASHDGVAEGLELTSSGNVELEVPRETEMKRDGAEKEHEEMMRDDQAEEEGSGPRQSWCTECHVGFPDEDTLIQHITDTHECASLSSKTQPDRLQQAGRFTPNGIIITDNGPGNTLEDEAPHAEENERARTDSERTENEKMESDDYDNEDGQMREKQVCDGGYEGISKGLPTRSESVGRLTASHRFQDASTAARPDASSPSSSSSSRKSSPLRKVPLNLLLSDDGEDRPRAQGQSASLITLVKPKDLFGRLDRSSPLPPPPPARPSSSSPPSRRTEAPGRVSSKSESSVRVVDHFLHASFASHPANVKPEPLSDHEDAPPPAFPRTCSPGSFYSLLHPPTPHPDPADLSPDLPRDLSMSSGNSPGSSSNNPSPRSLCSEGGRAPSFEKVVTPEVLFRARSPVQCPVQECGQQFRAFSELEEHSARLHRRHLCEYCGKSFTAKPNRDRHVRYHTGVKPYKCHICSQAFYRGDDLKYHRTTKHPKDFGY